MIVGMMGMNDNDEIDLSHLRKEVYNLKDVPRPFEADLYRKYGVSETVIAFWQEIGFTPAYYHLLWLTYDKQTENYEELMRDRAALVEGIKQENLLLGNAVDKYCETEKQALEWMMSSDCQYINALENIYNDGSASTLAMSTDMDVILAEMRRNVDLDIRHGNYEGRDYCIRRFAVSREDDGAINIDVGQNCGELRYSSRGTLTSVCYVKGFCYGGMGGIDILYPYIFLPHPFKKGDAVSYLYHNKETYYGVLAYAGDDDKTEKALTEGRLDGSDFTTTVETKVEIEEEKRFVIGHDHICPLFLEKANTDGENGDGPNPKLLNMMRLLVTGESDSLSSLSFYMG